MVVLVACGGPAPERPGRVAATAGTPDLICSSPPSGLRGKDPKNGGIEPRFAALQGAMHDLKSEIQACLRAADSPSPETQYELVMAVTGDATGSRVTSTSVKRVDGADADRTPVLANTNAEGCVAKLFARLALPPGDGYAEEHTIVRYDFCMPAVAIAQGTVGAYADAYRRWSADHRGTPCPTALSDLEGYAGGASTQDPWARPYVVRCSPSAFEVLSSGPDRQFGTADDLSSRR